jgi:hypothetical protein
VRGCTTHWTGMFPFSWIFVPSIAGTCFICITCPHMSTLRVSSLSEKQLIHLTCSFTFRYKNSFVFVFVKINLSRAWVYWPFNWQDQLWLIWTVFLMNKNKLAAFSAILRLQNFVGQSTGRCHNKTKILVGCTRLCRMPALELADLLCDSYRAWNLPTDHLRDVSRTETYSTGGEKRGKAILVRSRGGPWGCETSKLPHFLGNRLTDDGEAVSLTRRPAALYPQECTW